MKNNSRCAKGICGLLPSLLALLLISYVPMSFAAFTEGQEPNRSIEPAMQEIEESARNTPPQKLDEADPNIKKLDAIMTRWNLAERELVQMQAVTLRKGGSRLSWPYFLAGGRLNLLWKKQGLGMRTLETAERKYLPLVADVSLPEQMRLDYANRISMMFSNLINSKNPIPASLRKKFILEMAMAAIGAQDREFRNFAIESCIRYGGDVPEAQEAVFAAAQDTDPEIRKWCVWRVRFGSTKYGILSSPRRQPLIQLIGKYLEEGEARHDEDTLIKAMSSALDIANLSTERQERERIINWFGRVIKNGKSPRVRYRAYQALKGDSFFGDLYRSASIDEKGEIDRAVQGYDPEPDKAVSSGRKRQKDK